MASRGCILIVVQNWVGEFYGRSEAKQRKALCEFPNRLCMRKCSIGTSPGFAAGKPVEEIPYVLHVTNREVVMYLIAVDGHDRTVAELART